MKKKNKFALGASLMILASLCFFSSENSSANALFNNNVKALAEEEQHAGYCKPSENDCIGKCPDCGELVYADEKGEAHGIHEI